jgi:hypothetical protein
VRERRTRKRRSCELTSVDFATSAAGNLTQEPISRSTLICNIVLLYRAIALGRGRSASRRNPFSDRVKGLGTSQSNSVASLLEESRKRRFCSCVVGTTPTHENLQLALGKGGAGFPKVRSKA